MVYTYNNKIKVLKKIKNNEEFKDEEIQLIIKILSNKICKIAKSFRCHLYDQDELKELLNNSLKKEKNENDLYFISFEIVLKFLNLQEKMNIIINYHDIDIKTEIEN